jgi:lipopolysaccharide export system permease protein
VLSLLGLKSVGFFVFLMPLALFLALLWLLGRLNRDHESLVLLASGAGPWQLYRAVALPVLLVALLVAVLSGYLVPRTAALGYELRASASRDLDVTSLQPGRFHQLLDGRWLVVALRAGSEPGELEQVFVYAGDARRPQVLVAAQARVEGAEGADRYLVLYNGYRYDGVPGRADYRMLRYRAYGVRLQGRPVTVGRRWDAMSTAALWHNPGAEAAAELQARISRPVTVLVLTLLAVPMARFRPAQSRYYPLWMGALAFTLYFNLLNIAQMWIAQQHLPAWLGLWWVHALFLVPLVATGVSGWRSAGRAVV